MEHKIAEKLLQYGIYHLGLSPLDEIYFRNSLLRKLQLDKPSLLTKEELEEVKSLSLPDTLIDELRAYLLEAKLIETEKIELFIVELLGDITPLPSLVIEKFHQLEKESPDTALLYLYHLQIRNDYIKKSSVDKNIAWDAFFPDGNKLIITINMSKPEKNNKDVAKMAKVISNNYPKCVLCQENLGYQGRSDHAARENIRIIPLTLSGTKWFLQYSPYVYYNEHCIVIKEEHGQMSICAENNEKLLSFVDYFPSYFIGSNSDLPIVGGSILNHEHFQGGKEVFPMMLSTKKFNFTLPGFSGKCSYLNWYNSAFLLQSKNKNELLKAVELIRSTWASYDDSEANILSHEKEVRHSTLTPLVKKHGDEYYFYMILRNNLTSDEFPDGIFHAHKEHHNIKQEAIGLIEAIGLFILPARLKRQNEEIAHILSDATITLETYYQAHQDMLPHLDMINSLIARFGRTLDIEKAREVVKEYINTCCKSILENTAVFKNTPQGDKALTRFISKLGGKIC